MRRLLTVFQDWRESNHRRLVRQTNEQFYRTIAILLALIPALLTLSLATGSSLIANVFIIASMGTIVGFMLALLSVRSNSRSTRHY